MPRVVHFEIQADNRERAMTFYSTLFGWMFQKFPGDVAYWLVATGPKENPGIDGGLLPRGGGAPSGGAPVNASMCIVQVASADGSFEAATSNGGVAVVPKMPIPGVGWLTYCKERIRKGTSLG